MASALRIPPSAPSAFRDRDLEAAAPNPPIRRKLCSNQWRASAPFCSINQYISRRPFWGLVLTRCLRGDFASVGDSLRRAETTVDPLSLAAPVGSNLTWPAIRNTQVFVRLYALKPVFAAPVSSRLKNRGFGRNFHDFALARFCAKSDRQ